jgi:mRNA-degrading endonuclease RelE of RelBE toxin-antitoxin system
MGKFRKLSEAEEASFQKWIQSLPEDARKMIMNHNLRPDTLYKMKSTGKRVIVGAVDSHNLTVTVAVTHRFNRIAKTDPGYEIAGVEPDDLVECSVKE